MTAIHTFSSNYRNHIRIKIHIGQHCGGQLNGVNDYIFPNTCARLISLKKNCLIIVKKFDYRKTAHKKIGARNCVGHVLIDCINKNWAWSTNSKLKLTIQWNWKERKNKYYFSYNIQMMTIEYRKWKSSNELKFYQFQIGSIELN